MILKFETRNKTCTKIAKAWFLLVQWVAKSSKMNSGFYTNISTKQTDNFFKLFIRQYKICRVNGNHSRRSISVSIFFRQIKT